MKPAILIWGWIELLSIILLSTSLQASDDFSLKDIEHPYFENLPVLKGDESLKEEEKVNSIVAFLKAFLPHKANKMLQTGEEALRGKITHILRDKKPLTFALLAFPSKSLNEKYVISQKVDLGEYLGLLTLHHMVESISKIYPSVRCDIITDGPFYQDVLGQSDEAMTCYLQDIKKLVGTLSSKITFRTIQEFEGSPWAGKTDTECHKLIRDRYPSAIPSKQTFQSYNRFYKAEFDCDFYKIPAEKKVVFNTASEEDSIRKNKKYSYLTPTKAKAYLAQQIARKRQEAFNKAKADLVTSTAEFCALEGPKFSACVKDLYDGYKDSIRLSINLSDSVELSVKVPIALVFQSKKVSHTMPWMKAPVIEQSKRGLAFSLMDKEKASKLSGVLYKEEKKGDVSLGYYFIKGI